MSPRAVCGWIVASLLLVGGCGSSADESPTEPTGADAGAEEGAAGSGGADAAPDVPHDASSEASSDVATDPPNDEPSEEASEAGDEVALDAPIESGDADVDAAECASDLDCAAAHAQMQCVAGQCVVASCDPPFADCNKLAVDGCEADTSSDAAHCGSCAGFCLAAHGTPVCVAKQCEIGACDPGFGDCDASYANGCETNIATNVSACGACGSVCTVTNGSPACVGGQCTTNSCAAPFRDCDGDASNGCEIDTSKDAAHCGTCATACSFPHATAECAAGTCALAVCLSGWGDCDGVASNGCETNLLNDIAHCSACGVTCQLANAATACNAGACTIAACIGSHQDCDGTAFDGCEIDTATDSNHCGACGAACSLSHATSACVSGACAVGKCDAGFADCNDVASDGCEADLGSSATSCGACGKACIGAHVKTPACNGGACKVVACAPGWLDCDGDFSNGCETDGTTDAQHCGACNGFCSVAHGTPACVAGSCAIAACDPGFGDCDGVATNGCETPLDSLTDCGACDAACSLPHAGSTCTSGTCAITQCAVGYASCDGDPSDGCEVDTKTDVANCGGCGKACPAVGGATPVCNAGTCAVTGCPSGKGDCNGDPGDGCETDLVGNPTNCGACGVTCGAAHGTATCSGTSCAVVACDAGYGNCDGLYGNGCEAPLVSTANCGACGAACAPPHASGTCTTGACKIAACNAGFADCDGDPANGCEVDLQDDPLHCGSCAKTCNGAGGTPGCTAGQCTIACSSPFADCNGSAADGCEIDTSDDASHCGSCAKACGTKNGTASCSGGACSIACASGYGDCNGSTDDGCEASLKTNANCGACGTPCAIANGTGSCSTGTCKVTSCYAGFGDCDGQVGDGCEHDVSNDPTRCGSCSTVCNGTNGTATCAGGTCGITCAAGFADCDANAANGCEIATSSDPGHCGTCSNVCAADQTCGGGQCLACGIDHVLLSEIRSRGASGANDEFIELYNPTSSPVTLDTSWKIETRSTTGTSYVTRWTSAGGTIPAYGYWLIGGAGYTGPPSADEALTAGITDASSVRLVHGATVLDAVCYYYGSNGSVYGAAGSTYTCEGTPVSNAPHDDTNSASSNTAVGIARKGGAAPCADTGDNAADFSSGVTSTPQSSASTPTP